MKYLLAVLTFFVTTCYADVNAKLDNIDGTLMSTSRFENCTGFSIAVGAKYGNVRLTPTGCTVPPVLTVPSVCPNSGSPLQVVSRDLDWNIGGGIATYSDAFKTGQVYIYKMTTGLPSSGMAELGVAEYAATEVPEKTIIISERPCDFDALRTGNAAGTGTNPAARFTVGMLNDQGLAVLKPQTTYYVNIINARYDNVVTDTCSPGKDCRFVMFLRH